MKHTGFLQMYKVGNIGINANFVFLFICSFLPYSYHVLLVNVKLDVTGYKRITCQDKKVFQEDAYCPLANCTCFGGCHKASVAGMRTRNPMSGGGLDTHPQQVQYLGVGTHPSPPLNMLMPPLWTTHPLWIYPF